MFYNSLALLRKFINPHTSVGCYSENSFLIMFFNRSFLICFSISHVPFCQDYKSQYTTVNVISQADFLDMKGQQKAPLDQSQITPPGPPVKVTSGPPPVVSSPTTGNTSLMSWLA